MSVDRSNWVKTGAGGWLPTGQQLRDALQFRLREAIGIADTPNIAEPPGISTSMRQGMGLIVVTALLAGLLPFLVNWVIAARVGTALPVAQIMRSLQDRKGDADGAPSIMQAWNETAATIAGLDPQLPGWLAAGLSSFGNWLNAPLNWLALWIVYGLGILLIAKLLGATTTLQHFYAATSYAYLPLLLTGLSPIPCLGGLASLIGGLWALIIYVQAVQLVTRLDTGRAVISVFLPIAALLLLAILLLATFALSLLQLAF